MEKLVLENLSYVYGAGTPFEKKAIDDLNLEIEGGQFIGVIGHTGSGKSTLVQHLNGLLKPTSGRILIDGKDIWAEPKKIKEIRHRVGLVFQYPEYQLFEETVYKDICFGPTNMGLSGAELEHAVLDAVNFVGLDEEILTKSPFELSGGQKRRVAIAGVIAMQPEVLILDEPTAGLDPVGRDEILTHIRDYHRETGATVLLVSHSMEDIARYASRVLVMNHARIECYGTMPEVFAHAERLEEIGLSIPQITQVVLKLRERGFDLPKDIYTVEQAVAEILKRKGKGA